MVRYFLFMFTTHQTITVIDTFYQAVTNKFIPRMGIVIYHGHYLEVVKLTAFV